MPKKKTEPVPCPNCGHCPTCGHTPQRMAPIYPLYPWYPWYPVPYYPQPWFGIVPPSGASNGYWHTDTVTSSGAVTIDTLPSGSGTTTWYKLDNGAGGTC